jgi:histidinol phosphatase-like enzyme
MIIKPALILDLNGTIRVTKQGFGIPKTKEEIILNCDIESRIQQFKDSNFYIAILSNQSAVNKGLQTSEQMEEFFYYTLSLFKNPNLIDIAKFCISEEQNTEIPTNSIRSLNTKPNYGGLISIEQHAEFDGVMIDWSESLFIGNSDKDKFCARDAIILYTDIQEFLTLDIKNYLA